MNTCDTCEHYTASILPDHPFFGECALIPEENCYHQSIKKIDGCTPSGDGWNHSLGVGPKFGCIHWMAKESK